MKTRNTFLSMLAIAGTFMTTSCDDNDDKWTPDQHIVSALDSKYPGISKVDWDKEQNYYVADFRYENIEREAWFSEGGEWVMTESDITYEMLPQAVKTSFEASEYNSWRKEDIDMLERLNTETLYILDLEQGEQEVDLYYNEKGDLIKTVTDSDDHSHMPIQLTNKQQELINSRYAGATIVDVDKEARGTEIEIKHENIYKEVYFNNNDEWQHTTWDIYYRNNSNNGITEEAVKNAIRNYESQGYQVDDVNLRENANGTVYIVEFEKEHDIEIVKTFDMEGNEVL